MATKRLVAKKCLIEQLISGTYVKTAGWDPSYVLVGTEQITIANVMGIVVEKTDKIMIIDDGTGNITVRFFENNAMPEIKVGETVQVVGRVSEHDNNKFITGQAVGKVSIDWLKVRKEEIKHIKHTPKKPVEEKNNEPKEITDVYNIKDDLIEKIRKLDPGEGVEVTTLINGDTETERAVRSLLEEGEIFEVIPGRVKVLE